MADDADALLRAAAWAEARGGKERLIWQTSLLTLIDNEPGFLEARAGEVAALVLDTLPAYEARSQQRAVNRLVRAALGHEAYVKAFAAALLRAAASKQAPQAAFRLLEWSCMLLEALPPEGSAKAAAKLLEAQGGLLDALHAADTHPLAATGRGARRGAAHHWSAAQRAVLRLLRARPGLAADYQAAAAASGSPGLVRIALQAALPRRAGAAQQQQQQQGEPQQLPPGAEAAVAALLPVLCDRVLAAPERPSAALLSAFAPLLRALTPEQVADKVLPAVSRAARRTPEPAIAALGGALELMTLNLSTAAPELVALLLQQLRAKEAVRGVAGTALAALAARVQDAGVAGALVAKVTGVLDGSAEGKIKLAGERAALAAALASLSALPRTPDMAAVAAGAATFCAGAVKDEPVEEVKLALLAALAEWLPRCAEVPTPVATGLAGALGDAKDSVRRTALVAAMAAVRDAPGLASGLAPLAAPLAKLVTEGCAKAVARGNGIAALLLAAQVAAADAGAAAALAKAGVWDAPLAADSPLLSAATLAKLAPADAAPAAELAQTLLACHGDRLQPASHAAVCQLLALCLLHHSLEVRRRGVAAGRPLMAGAPALLGPLLAGLRHWANAPTEALVLAEPGEAVSDAAGTYSHAFARALLALLPFTERAAPGYAPAHHTAACAAALEGRGLAELLLMAHHPAITAGVANKHATWAAACRRLLGTVPAALKSGAPGVLAVLLGDGGLGSPCPGDVAAAQLALGSAMAAAPGGCLDPLLAGLAGWLDRSRHDAVSDDDIAVWRTPEGLLASEVVPEGVYVPEVVVSKNVRKARGRFRVSARLHASARARVVRRGVPGLQPPARPRPRTDAGTARPQSDNRAFATADDDDDDDDEPAPAKPAAAARPSAVGAGGRGGARGGGAVSGKGPKDAAARQAEFRARKLEEEAEVRRGVVCLQARLDTGLAALRAAVEGNTAFAASHLRELGALCQPLLGSPICGDAAFAAVRSLARCMPPPLGGRSLLLAGCLRLVGLAARRGDGVSYETFPSAPGVADVLAALCAATVAPRRPLPGPSYALVFPVLAAVLSCPVISPLHDDALRVLGLHVSPEQDIPRGESLELCYAVLGRIPAFRDRVAPLLRSLCAGVGEPELMPAVSGLLAGSPAVRACALAALPSVPTLAEGVQPESGEALAVLALARHDSDETNATAAQELWAQAGCSLGPDVIALLVRHITSDQPDTRGAAAAALADALRAAPACTPSCLEAVLALYGDDLEPDDEVAAAVLLDDAERAARDAARDAQANARRGVASGLEALAGVLGSDEVRGALHFLVTRGLAEPRDDIREAMVAAGVALVESRGDSLSQALLPQFEGYLEPGAAARLGVDEARYDLVREGVVVLLGMMAGHLAPGDDKRRSIIGLLLEVLSTPSEAVQRAVSNCLPRLVAPLAEDKAYVEGLLDRLLEGLRLGGQAGYGLRRGAAYGLAGAVKGLGMSSLKGYGLLEALKARVEDKRDPEGREGALQAFECLCEKLGRLFEPYVIHILPLLLQCFGDASPQVRAAAEDAARSIMGQLSASGVKLVLPALLKGLEDSAWRTKQGSIQLLGAMAHCAPKQLGSCLPTIVPRLSSVLSDAHPKVQAAAKEALGEVSEGRRALRWRQAAAPAGSGDAARARVVGAPAPPPAVRAVQVGSVIRSPEMAALVPGLMAAIAEPNASTRPCLDTLLGTTFIHTIDAPSLALLVPVVHRGLRDRSGDTKKRAARIVGNMCSLTNDPKDMTPYVPLLMPELQKALLDPLPEVRATAARAMGSLLKGMGPAALGDLLPWLLATLRSEGSSVERSGAAQGLAEVLAVMGEAHLGELLPELEASAGSKNPFVREGHLTLFRYLPLTMEAPFQDHLGEVLPLILDGLSDEVEGVRDAALAAGRCFVEAYARSCLPLLLPAVEAGLDGDNWRIRQSSLELCGELLFKVAGTSGKVKLDGGSDDEGAACETYGVSIQEALGRERNAEVLSKLYVARSDVQYVVRNTGLHIWKTIVVNTPRTLQEILPALMAEVIRALAAPGEDRRSGAARCLGELVRKMGERVLHRMLPILRDTMASPDAATRQGVCTGLKELLENVTRHQLGEHLSDILPPIQSALCDADPAVREAAGAAFGVLFKGGAHGAVESVVPSLLHGLDSPAHAAQSMEGLRVILSVRPQVFNGIVPKLLKPPTSSAGLRSIGQLAGTASSVLMHHIPAIMATCLALASGHAPAGQANGADAPHDPREEAASEAALAVALATDEESVRVLVSELLKGLEDVAGRALGAARLLAAYARSTKHSLTPYVDELLTALVLLLAEDDDVLVLAAWEACEALAGSIPKEDAPGHVAGLKDAIAGAREKERRKRRGGPLQLRGLLLPPKALAPFVPIYLQGVLQGSSPEVREVAAEGLGELIVLTSEEGLKPFVVAITGPLIRIIGDRFPPATKAAILVTLGLLIRRASAGLKPFVPQLQTTFLKCLNDQADAVRMTAADNLGELTRLSARVEALVGDLAANAASAADPETSAAYLVALRGALRASGDRLTQPTLDKVQGQLLELYKVLSGRPGATSGGVDPQAAALVSAMAQFAAVAGHSRLSQLLSAGPLSAAGISGSKEARELAAMLLAAVASAAAPSMEEAGVLRAAVEAAAKATRDAELASVKTAGGRAVVRLFAAHRNIGPALVGAMTTLLGPDQSSEVQRQAMVSLSKLAAADDGALQPHLVALLPSICSILQREPNSQVKAAAEQLLKRALRLAEGLEVGQGAAAGAGGATKSFLTDAYLRRLQKLAEDEWVEQEEY
ncbi:hypothetical protein HT031_006591 [Scenedesmus sp. PABB004]|nr:hypothetical protein HT031_006591 [Scenedesmus sp. PABB004]